MRRAGPPPNHRIALRAQPSVIRTVRVAPNARPDSQPEVAAATHSLRATQTCSRPYAGGAPVKSEYSASTVKPHSSSRWRIS